ncbi:Dihydromonacolin L monooxygenase LovA 6 [Paraphaeosphaeria minitans]|uniref:Dihydromonacolin L monooxygenase LovA 6 n=1 Tax=Paraphaeosphaeria minitans TaxID=565426 RepID=A0A9P6GQ28_9PLEO|nr:Dihydromonacolin L monooxygenase LovA 6 [Paraphaeosphaeria minitans]
MNAAVHPLVSASMSYLSRQDEVRTPTPPAGTTVDKRASDRVKRSCFRPSSGAIETRRYNFMGGRSLCRPFSDALLNPDVYKRPERFDGYRADHFVFGMGKLICPGRVFAVTEVKTAPEVILLTLDVKLEPGYFPKTI